VDRVNFVILNRSKPYFEILEAVRTAFPSNGSKLYEGVEVRRSLGPVLGCSPRAAARIVL